MNKYISPEMAVSGIVIALSIAIFPVTIVISYGSLKVEAAKLDKRCYTTFHSGAAKAYRRIK